MNKRARARRKQSRVRPCTRWRTSDDLATLQGLLPPCTDQGSSCCATCLPCNPRIQARSNREPSVNATAHTHPVQPPRPPAPTSNRPAAKGKPTPINEVSSTRTPFPPDQSNDGKRHQQHTPTARKWVQVETQHRKHRERCRQKPPDHGSDHPSHSHTTRVTALPDPTNSSHAGCVRPPIRSAVSQATQGPIQSNNGSFVIGSCCFLLLCVLTPHTPRQVEPCAIAVDVLRGGSC